jgi:UDP-glucose 4-epimerase
VARPYCPPKLGGCLQIPPLVKKNRNDVAMKCLILGGGGFIGSAIVENLLLRGYDVRIFERPRVASPRVFRPDESVQWVTGDLASSHDVEVAMHGCDVIVHLVSATLPQSSNDDPVYDVQSNLVTTLQILKLMVLHKIPRIVFISSGGTVYGNPDYLPIDEKHRTEPQVSYGITKLAIEKYLLMYERLHGIRAVILRVANPYGERQRVETAQGAVAVFLNRAMRGLPIEIWGDGSTTRDFLYVADVAEAFARAITYAGTHSVFNISSGAGTSLNHLIDMVDEALGITVRRVYKAARPFDVPVSVLSNDLARLEFDWRPQVSLRDGLVRTIRWLKSESTT